MHRMLLLILPDAAMPTLVSDDRQGIQSIEVGFRLLDVLAATSRPMMLRDIAKGAGMPAAKAHRYMVSFMRIGSQSEKSFSNFLISKFL